MQSPVDEPVPYFVHPRPASWGSAVIAETGKTVLRPLNSAAFNDPTFSGVSAAAGYNGPSDNTVHNFVYATNGPHPSDIVVANDAGYEVRMDQVFVVATSNSAEKVANSAYAKTPETQPYTTEYLKRGFTGHGNGQKFGYATCHWIRHCTSSEMIGSACTATHGTVSYSGFCFKSDTGSLECGRLTAMDDEYGESPVFLGGQLDQEPVAAGVVDKIANGNSQNVLPGQSGVAPNIAGGRYASTIPNHPGTFRCPAGSPAKSLGYFISKRMLIAGCMVNTDANYNSLAEIHVPAYCASPADYLIGCLMPGATNFDPLAKQSGECRYITYGCMSPTAVNYNSRATLADPQNHPCIEARIGCTVNPTPYAGYATVSTVQTPGTFGASNSLVGVMPNPTGPSVLNYGSNFNVLATSSGRWSGTECIVAIEGCMDSTARNYDPQANVQTGTWCVPLRTGCMMPVASASVSFSKPTVAVFDGITSNYDPAATQHVPTACTLYRQGCRNSAALNYDALATVDSACIMPKMGCLNPLALNTGCSSPDTAQSCSETPPVTVHSSFTCNWVRSPPAPPAPPVPPSPPGVYEVVLIVSMDLAVAAKGEPYTVTEQDGMKDAYRLALGASSSVVIVLTILYDQNAAGRRLQSGDSALVDVITLAAEFDTPAAASSAQGAAATSFSSASAATSLFAAAGVQLTVVSTPSITTATVNRLVAGAPMPPAPPPPAGSGGTVAAVMIGVIVGCILIGGAVMFIRQKIAKDPTIYPA